MVRPTTLFSQEERIWIIFKYGELKSHVKVRRAFRLHFNVPNPYKFNTWDEALKEGIKKSKKFVKWITKKNKFHYLLLF